MSAALKMGVPSMTEFKGPPQIPAEQSWITRAANFAVRLTRAKSGTTLARADNPDEYFLLLPDVGATVSANARQRAGAARTSRRGGRRPRHPHRRAAHS